MHPARASIKLNGRRYDGQSPKPKSVDTVKAGSDRPRGKHHLSKHPARSTTLMRHAVSKPARSAHPIDRVSVPLDLTARAVTVPTFAGNVDPKLMRRAKSFKPSRQISRFGSPTRSTAAKSTFVPKPQPLSQPAAAVPTAARIAGASLLEHALDKATSHTQPKLSRKELRQNRGKRSKNEHKIMLGVIGVSALLVVAYVIYANLPNVMVKVASVHAGFAATLPRNRPSGYSLSSVGYDPGVVSFNFKSNIDNRRFTLTERSSTWNSATLVANVIVPLEGSDYHKLVTSNVSIYFFGSDDAAWVNRGIWYQLSANGSLSTNQIIQLAGTN